MGKQISPEEAGDINESPGVQLSGEELKVYVDGPPKNDRTTTIQNSFAQLQTDPDITNEKDQNAFRDSVIRFLKRETFSAFPEISEDLNPRLLYRTADGAPHGSDIYSFISEKGWRLKVDIRWKNDLSTKNPLMIVLKSPNENRWDSEAFINGLDSDQNVAFLKCGVWAKTVGHPISNGIYGGLQHGLGEQWPPCRCMTCCAVLSFAVPCKVWMLIKSELLPEMI
jgi:hypothetical protein